MNPHIELILNLLKQNPDLKYIIYEQDWQTDFLRFYHSQTNYNISKDSLSISVSLFKGKKSYSFDLDNPDTEVIKQSMADALVLIDQVPEDPDFVDVEDDQTILDAKPKINNIERLPLDKKTEILSEIAAAVADKNFELYGTFICNYEKHRLINSNGLNKSWEVSPIYFEVKAVHNVSQVTVLQTFGGEDFGKFDQAEFIRGLVSKIDFASNPIVDVEPGQYDVILAPRCIAEYIQYLSYGMSAQAYDQRSSYFEEKIGQQVFPENITIVDDPKDTDMVVSLYNSEGHAYNPLTLINKGKFEAFTCGSYYHFKTGLPKNGNTCNNLRLEAGEDKLEDMIASIKHGLYISSLHYMNFINAKETSLTGLTRDGTFLIEDGKITKVVNNLRFTERIERILKNIVALGDKSEAIPFSGNYSVFSIETAKAPHVKVKGFNITSSTKTI